MSEKDIPVFARNDPHDIRLQVLLNADEYVYATQRATDIGLSGSAYVRKLINDDRRSLAQKQLSADTESSETSQSTQPLHNLVKALVQAIKAEL